jgi:hypothetical protein
VRAAGIELTVGELLTELGPMLTSDAAVTSVEVELSNGQPAIVTEIDRSVLTVQIDGGASSHEYDDLVELLDDAVATLSRVLSGSTTSAKKAKQIVQQFKDVYPELGWKP